MIALAVVVGGVIAAAFAVYGDAAPEELGVSVAVGCVAALAVAILGSLWSWFGGAGAILRMSGAHEITKDVDPELFNVVDEVRIAAGLPMPRVFLIDETALNAFATGRDPRHAAVAITTGLRSRLTRDELQGVMAHEMAHVRNYDIRLMLLMAVLVGTVVMLADVFLQVVFRTRGGSSSRGRGGKGGGAILIVLIVIGIILAIIAPMLAQIIQLAVSRQREYLADATAVQFTRYPQGLADALRKLAGDTAQLRTANRGTAHLFIVNPIKKFAARADSVFASHPPIRERIQRLEALGQ
jgi:heat shock protein HtpX